MIAAGTASKTIAKQPAACSASASSAICAAWSAVLPWALKPPSAVAVCGVRPTWPITGIPARTIARARSTEAPPRSSLTASQPASLTKRCALSIACSFELLVGAERQVADEQRRPQPAPHGRGQHQHLVHADRRGDAWPSTVIAAVSPTRTRSTPAASATWAEGSRRR